MDRLLGALLVTRRPGAGAGRKADVVDGQPSEGAVDEVTLVHDQQEAAEADHGVLLEGIEGPFGVALRPLRFHGFAQCVRVGADKGQDVCRSPGRQEGLQVGGRCEHGPVAGGDPQGSRDDREVVQGDTGAFLIDSREVHQASDVLHLRVSVAPPSHVAGEGVRDGSTTVEVLVRDDLSAQFARLVGDHRRPLPAGGPGQVGERQKRPDQVALLGAFGQRVGAVLDGSAGEEHQRLGHQQSPARITQQVEYTRAERIAQPLHREVPVDVGTRGPGLAESIEEFGAELQHDTEGKRPKLPHGIARIGGEAEDLAEGEIHHQEVYRLCRRHGRGNQPARPLLPLRGERGSRCPLENGAPGNRHGQIGIPQ